MKWCIGILIMLFIGMVARICYENTHFTISRYEITSKEFPKGFRSCKLVFLSDLHNSQFKKQDLFEAIKKEQPDVILIGGDMIVGKKETTMEPAFSLLHKLKKLNVPIYYGMGNHEYRLKIYQEQYGDMFTKLQDKLKELSIPLLENSKVTLQKGVNLFGLEIDRSYYKRFKRPKMEETYIEEVLGKCPREDYNILLAHNPIFFHQYVNWGANLTLAGHMHGGMVRIPFLGAILSPQLRLFPNFTAGLYEKENKKMLVSRGLGSHTIRIRFMNVPELMVIQLKEEQ